MSEPYELAPEDAAEKLVPAASPEELLAAVETPGAFRDIAKADLFLEMARLRRLFRTNQVALADRLKYLQMLSRMAGVDVGAPDGEFSSSVAVPQVNIVINGQQAIKVGS
jgi:hypothetical protein